MVGRNWFTISKAAIISLIVVNSTLWGEEKKEKTKVASVDIVNKTHTLTLLNIPKLRTGRERCKNVPCGWP